MGFLEHYPDLEAGVTPSAVHPVTGAFAEPSHETAFAAQLFRTAFPCHVILLALTSTILVRAWLSAPLDLFVSTAALCMTLSLVGRVLIHCRLNVVRGQRLGAWAWTAQAIVWCVISVGVYVRAPRAECALLRSHDLAGFAGLTGALVNGSHGLRFWHKLGLVGLMLLGSLCAIASCGEVSLAGESMVLAGFVVAHMVEVHLRHNYFETRRLEERNEQLRGEKERLLYDLQRRSRPLDDADDRSAIRRGLQAGCSKHPSPSADGSTSSDRSGTKPSSDLSPPPGPPSSNSGESTTAEQAQPTEPDSNVTDLVARHVEKEVAHLLLSCARGGHANHQCESTEASTKEACTSATATACSTSAAPISSPSVALTHATATSSAAAEAELIGSYLAARAATEDELNERVPAPEPAPGISLDTDSLVASGGVSTPEEAILVARRDIMVAQDQIQVQRVVRTLGMALGASRIETGTAKALHAVLLQLARPGVSDIEAYRSTGASRSNFTKWRRRVQQILERQRDSQRRASIRARGSAPALIYEHERVNGATYLPATTPPSVHASGSHSCAPERLDSYYY